MTRIKKVGLLTFSSSCRLHKQDLNWLCEAFCLGLIVAGDVVVDMSV